MGIVTVHHHPIMDIQTYSHIFFSSVCLCVCVCQFSHALTVCRLLSVNNNKLLSLTDAHRVVHMLSGFIIK